MRTIFLLLIISVSTFAQTDFTNLKWKFRGPTNYDLGVKGVIDITTDPDKSQKLWACTVEDGLLFNENIEDENSLWQKSTLADRRIYKLRFDPSKPLVAYALGDFVNWKTTDGGKTWSEITYIKDAYSRCQDIWVSKKGALIISTRSQIFLSDDEGKSWKLIFSSFNIIKQVWVQENERIYVLQANNSGVFSDANYTKWNDISITQMRKEEFPYSTLEEFNSYVVESGEIFHGFTRDRRKIKLEKSYSVDGGKSYNAFESPSNTVEAVFVGEHLVFATPNGVFIYKDSKLSERNKGKLQGEYQMIDRRRDAGDNNYVGLSSKGMFFLNNLDYGQAYQVQSVGNRVNSFSVQSKSNFVAVEGQYSITNSLLTIEGRKIVPIRDNINLYITNDNGGLGRFIANRTGNTSEGYLSPLGSYNGSSIVDLYYNDNLNKVFCLYRDGSLMILSNPNDIGNSGIKEELFKFENPTRMFEKGIIEEVSSDGNQLLVSDKSKNLFLIFDEGNGKKIKQINTDALNGVKINHMEFSIIFQRLFLATEKGVFMGEDILTDSPKWTNISKEIGEQPCVFVQLRSTDGELSVLTSQNGIFSTIIFSEPNQIVTHAPTYITKTNPPTLFPISGLLDPFICNKSKIKIDFTTNIPTNQGVKYIVEVSDINGNFPAQPFILEGEATQSPVEVDFVKPQDENANLFRFRVLARGAVNVIGSSTPPVYVDNDKNFVHETIKKVLKCEKESIELIPTKGISNGSYQWKNGNDIIAETVTYKTSQTGTYRRTAEINGCNVSSVFEVTASPDMKPLYKLNVGVSYAGNTCMVDSFKLFTDYNSTYKYVWYRDDLVMNNADKQEIFIKDKSEYKVLVTNQDGCSAVSEIIKLKACDNGNDSRVVILNQPTISVDKNSIYSGDKATLRLESCENVSMQWLKDNKPLLGANQNFLEVTERGNYALQISKFGCTTLSKSIDINIETILAVGEETFNFSVEVYPNPTEEKLFVSIPTVNTLIEVKLTDISGKLVGNYDFSKSNSQSIDLKNFANGVYFLIFDLQGKRVVKKIIKNN